MRTRKLWTHEEEKQLIKDYKQGRSYEDMAKMHGVSKGAIRSKLYFMRKDGVLTGEKRY